MPIKQHIFKRYFEYDGKRYEIHAIRQKKENAEKIAVSLRKRGFLVRVQPYYTSVAEHYSRLSGKRIRIGDELPPYAVYKRAKKD